VNYEHFYLVSDNTGSSLGCRQNGDNL